MSPLHGYHGRYLRIDATTGRAAAVPLAESVLRGFLGGVGLAAWIVAHETPAGLDPLGPEAVLVFAFSPLVGSPLTTSAKFAVAAFSPLTGRFCDALSSSHFALAGKRTGHDALLVAGRAERPSIMLVDGTGEGPPRVLLEPAGDTWGQPAHEAEQAIRSRFGADWQVAAIGPAGENLVPFASVSHDGRHAGRGGLGAVLGSKNVKALAVKGDRRAAPADPIRTVGLAKDLSVRSFGPATEKYRELGTVANLLVFNRFDALPSRNFQAGHADGVEALAAADLAPARRLARNSCASCTIGCEHVYPVKRAEAATGEGPMGVRLEYESLFALGPLCGVHDPDAVLRAAATCDALGLDTISTGGTLAFAMECVARGWIDGTLPGSGRLLAFGDGEAVVEGIVAIAGRAGTLGSWMALGSRRAAERLGAEALAIAPQVKGLELPGYHPARLPAMALGLAVGTRGADHNRSGAYEADFSERLGPDPDAAQVAEAVVETEDRAALMDSLILCKFLRGALRDLHAESVAMLSAVTGWDVTEEELRTVARRVVAARKCLNRREGATRAEDTLPARFFTIEPTGSRPALSRDRLDAQIAAYYVARGWTDTGDVPRPRREELGLSDPAFGSMR